MTLFNALASLAKKAGYITGASLTHFAISDNTEEVAFFSQLPLAELVPLLERWCAERRAAGELKGSTN